MDQYIPFYMMLFADDYGSFLMTTYSEKWSHLTDGRGIGFTEWSSVPKIFTVDIGKASFSYRILQKLVDKMRYINFDILSFFYAKDDVSSLLYVKEHARSVYFMNGGSFFLLCTFVGQVSVLSVKKDHRHLAHLPLMALSDILYEEKLITSNNIQKVQDIATTINIQYAKLEEAYPMTRSQTTEEALEFFLHELYTLWTGKCYSKQ
ncbi:hypothetical protein TNIN_339971 [Trichonephila inaurata madagascariensis]|uniref:Uncharacterized protein n=1 Tax=Trichonephila inaurata madagascariensis TaxID=2747483 RepID=A0A8X6XCM9_9ARAC|nr:hypothetical protein TNIN_339971 [Trichonephila inaurata madagascariensis]